MQSPINLSKREFSSIDLKSYYNVFNFILQSNHGFTEFVQAPSTQHFNNNPSNVVNHVGNLLSGGSRPSREQSQQNVQQLSSFGQCGKKNAKGLTGRIASSDFREGDTDFGKLKL